MEQRLTIFILLTFIGFSLKGQRELLNTSCFISNPDSLDLISFWSSHPKVYNEFKNDTSTSYSLIWIEKINGSIISNLTLLVILENELQISSYVNDKLLKYKLATFDWQFRLNLLKLLEKVESGNYIVNCPLKTSDGSDNVYFIFKKGKLILSIYSGKDKLQDVTLIDRAILANTANLFDFIYMNFIK